MSLQYQYYSIVGNNDMFSIGQPKPNSKKHIYQLHYSPKLHQKLLQQSDISISQTSSQVSNQIPNNLQINRKISPVWKYQQKNQKVCSSNQSQNREETEVSRDSDKNRKWWGKVQIGLAVVAAEIRANVENFILSADSQSMSKKLEANIQVMLLNMLDSATKISTLCNTISQQAPQPIPQPMKIPINSQRISDKSSSTSNISRNDVVNNKNPIKKSLIKIEDSCNRDEEQDQSSIRQNDEYEYECEQECLCKEQDGRIGQDIGRLVDGRLSVLRQASYEVSSQQNSMYSEQKSNIFNPQYPQYHQYHQYHQYPPPSSQPNLLQQLLKLPTQIPQIPSLLSNYQNKSLKIQENHHKILNQIPYRKDNKSLYQCVSQNCQQLIDNYCLDDERRQQSQQDLQSDIGSELAIQQPSWFGVRGRLGEEVVEECSISQYYIEDSPTPHQHKQTQQKQNILPTNNLFSHHHHPSTSNCHTLPKHHPPHSNLSIQQIIQKDPPQPTNINKNTTMHDSNGSGYIYSQVLSRRKIF